jgi:hypothetical protein
MLFEVFGLISIAHRAIFILFQPSNPPGLLNELLHGLVRAIIGAWVMPVEIVPSVDSAVLPRNST